MLRLTRDGLAPAWQRSRLGVVAGLCGALALGCGTPPRQGRARVPEAGGPSSRIEERSLSDRPPLAVIERQGDPEIAIAFASLAAASPELHAVFGEVLRERAARSGFQTQLVTHGLGFELVLLAENPARARLATQALLQALARPIASADLAGVAAPTEPDRTPTSAVGQCSAELTGRRRAADATELERARVAAFARDRAAWGVVGDAEAAAAVGEALGAGPDWPELGRVRSILSDHDVTEVLHGERPTLSVAVAVSDANRALGAAASLGDAKSALGIRLGALGAGLRVRRVVATAHPRGACLRIDSDLDASPLPDVRRLGFAVRAIEEEAALSLARAEDDGRLDATALSATDPRAAARAAAYRALIEPAPDLPTAQLVALTTPDEAPLLPSLEAAIRQAQTDAPAVDARVVVEAGQPGIWALLATPCAAAAERAEIAGHGVVFFQAATANAPRGVRLEPWVGAEGLGIVGFTERAPGESDAEAASRLGDALGQAMLTPPSAPDVASARGELLRALGDGPHALLESLLESLAPGHLGALAPRGTATSLQAASLQAVATRQRELLRLPHKLAILSPTTAEDAAFLTRSLSRWLNSPDAPRASACETEINPPARSELSVTPGGQLEGSYLAFRVPAKFAAEASVLSELLNAPGGLLARTLSEPDLVGAARARLFGTAAARALVVQISAFDGREPDALGRVQKLFERLASGGALSPTDVEAALGRLRTARRLAALDPRYRLVELLDSAPAEPIDAAALRKLTSALRPDAAVIGRTLARTPPATGKTQTSR